MLGWAWWHRPRSAATIREARRAFERALEIDPRSVNARVGLARLLTVELSGNFRPANFEPPRRSFGSTPGFSAQRFEVPSGPRSKPSLNGTTPTRDSAS